MDYGLWSIEDGVWSTVAEATWPRDAGDALPEVKQGSRPFSLEGQGQLSRLESGFGSRLGDVTIVTCVADCLQWLVVFLRCW